MKWNKSGRQEKKHFHMYKKKEKKNSNGKTDERHINVRLMMLSCKVFFKEQNVLWMGEM